MDWLSLQQRYAVPAGASARTARLLALKRVLDGTQYDALPHPFSMEKSGRGIYPAVEPASFGADKSVPDGGG